jgi:class 3 adenylate cyclase
MCPTRAAVLFTDIVESTRLATDLGDRRSRALLEAHQSLIREQLERFGGREIKTTGDGFLAIFDGPTRAAECARIPSHSTSFERRA